VSDALAQPPAIAGPLVLALLAPAAPIFAILSEGWFGLAPCELCLWQRWPYAAAALLAMAALALPRARRPLQALAAIAVLASGAVAGFHAGVEFGWWPSPLAGCQAQGVRPGMSAADAFAALPAAPSKPCDAPTFLIPGLPVSMAAMNLLFALALGGYGLISLRANPLPRGRQ
jgi:disulfide bond formation protein DsbB